MKKVLTVLLAVVMMFAFSATAFAADYTDIDNCTDAGKVAINKLSALEVLEGKGDGKFDPAGDVTRAEMAKICTILAGKLDVAEKLMDKASDYTDVKVSVWYTGYVNEADALGIVQGDPAGTFRPNDNVTMAEAIAMLLRTAGYTDNLPGPWYIDYLNQAVEEGLVDDVDFVYNKAASREEVAIMADALLDVDIVEWSVEEHVNDHVVVEPGYDVLAQAFGDIAGYMVVEEIEVNDQIHQLIEVNGEDLAQDFVIENANLTDLMGREVFVIYNWDNEEIVYMAVTDEIIEVAEAEESGSKVKLDGVVYDYADDYMGYIEDIDDDYYNVTGYAHLNADGELLAAWADVDNYVMFGEYELVTEVAVEDDEWTVYTEDQYGTYEYDEDDLVLFMEDGQFIEASDIEAGDVVVYRADCDVYEVISDLAVAGTVDRTDTAEGLVQINGDWYAQDAELYLWDEDVLDYAFDMDMNKWKYAMDAEYEFDFIVGTDNAIQFVLDTEEETEYVYALVTNEGITEVSAKGQVYVDLYTEDGTVEKVVSGDVDVEDLILAGEYLVSINEDNELDAAIPVVNDNVDAEGAALPSVAVNDNKTLQVNGREYPLADDVVIFNVLDDLDVDPMTADEVLDVKQINQGEIDIYALATDAAWLTVEIDEATGEVTYIGVTNMNASYDGGYAIVEEADDNYVTLDGIELEAADKYDYAKGKVVTYVVNDGVATVTEVQGFVEKFVAQDFVAGHNLINCTDGTQLHLADDALFAELQEDGSYEWVEGLVIEEGTNFDYILDDETGEVELIRVLD